MSWGKMMRRWGRGGRVRNVSYSVSGILVAKCLYVFIELPLAKQGNLVEKKKGGIFFQAAA